MKNLYKFILTILIMLGIAISISSSLVSAQSGPPVPGFPACKPDQHSGWKECLYGQATYNQAICRQKAEWWKGVKGPAGGNDRAWFVWAQTPPNAVSCGTACGIAPSYCIVAPTPTPTPVRTPTPTPTRTPTRTPTPTPTRTPTPVIPTPTPTPVPPKIYIGPSDVTVVSGPTQCTGSGPRLNVSFKANLKSENGVPFSDGSTKIDQDASGGAYDFSAESLKYNTSYILSISNIGNGLQMADLTFCNGGPSRTYNLNGTSIPALAGYPNIPPEKGKLDGSFKVYFKETNKWWQAYNGGVHSNSSPINFEANVATGEGMPAEAVLIADPAASTVDYPNHVNLGVGYYAGGLVSIKDTNLDEGFYGLVDKNWGFEGNTKSMRSYDFDEIMKSVVNWSSSASLSAAISGAPNYVRINSASVSSGAAINYSGIAANKTIVIAANSGNSALAITNNIGSAGTGASGGIPIILVKGDVTIAPNVSQIRAVIYATGNITIESAGEDIDVPLIVEGALYAQGSSINFRRDLADTAANVAKPAQQVLYSDAIFMELGNIGKVGVSGTDFPSDLTESLVYWEIE